MAGEKQPTDPTAEWTREEWRDQSLFQASLVAQLNRDCLKLRDALAASVIALDDWLNVYAAEFCDEVGVAAAHARIRAAGGTLAYLARVQQQNREALSDA